MRPRSRWGRHFLSELIFTLRTCLLPQSQKPLPPAARQDAEIAFGQYLSALQGDPAPKPSEERCYDKLQRDIQELTGGFDTDVASAIKAIEASDHRRETERTNNIGLHNPPG
ncbi:hypothetical protein [Bythopirellula polymerisocia]|uniref:hypothetical protein n=1 Tax=Bythopirellula polymerisocia TaxID=2528003 RepID=UPI0011B4A81F|nr:hypothetical protein [Bythopirellula polymerisocia]